MIKTNRKAKGNDSEVNENKEDREKKKKKN